MNAPDQRTFALEVGDRVSHKAPGYPDGTVVGITRGLGWRNIDVKWDDMRNPISYQRSELIYAGNGLELMLKLIP